MPVYMTYGVWALYCQFHLECIFLINKSTFKLQLLISHCVLWLGAVLSWSPWPTVQRMAPVGFPLKKRKGKKAATCGGLDSIFHPPRSHSPSSAQAHRLPLNANASTQDARSHLQLPNELTSAASLGLIRTYAAVRSSFGSSRSRRESM